MVFFFGILSSAFFTFNLLYSPLCFLSPVIWFLPSDFWLLPTTFCLLPTTSVFCWNIYQFIFPISSFYFLLPSSSMCFERTSIWLFFYLAYFRQPSAFCVLPLDLCLLHFAHFVSAFYLQPFLSCSYSLLCFLPLIFFLLSEILPSTFCHLPTAFCFLPFAFHHLSTAVWFLTSTFTNF